MEVKDYYKVLEIERTASAEEIKKAYLRLARMFHPDTHPDDEGCVLKFHEVAEAYKVLGNLDSRLKYSIQLNKRMKLPKNIPDGKLNDNWIMDTNNKSDFDFLGSLSILFRENLFFFLPYLAFLVMGIFEITMLKKGDSLIWINKMHTPFLDTFFYYTTVVGDGVLYAVVIVPLVLYRVRYGFIGVLAFASSGIVTQIIKRILAMPRPKSYFPPSTVLHYVPGLSIYMTNSMPSGHSATSFSMFLLLSILTPFKPLGSLYFVCALLVALSRIYLVEHFFVDTYVGSLIGVICTILTFLLVTRYLLPASKWAEYSVYRNRIGKKTEIRNKK